MTAHLFSYVSLWAQGARTVLEAEVQELRGELDRLESHAAELEARKGALEGEVAVLRGTVAELEASVAAGSADRWGRNQSFCKSCNAGLLSAAWALNPDTDCTPLSSLRAGLLMM